MMKFLIDENLPLEVADVFIKKGVRCFHVNQIKREGQDRISDGVLRKYAIYRDYIIVTKDYDFVDSWRSRKVPDKVIFVHHQKSKPSLLKLFEVRLGEILKLLEQNDFLELNENGVRLPFGNSEVK